MIQRELLKKLRIKCFHEAGHAIAAIRLGVELKELVIERSKDEGLVGWVDPIVKTPCLEHGITAMAGPIAGCQFEASTLYDPTIRLPLGPDHLKSFEGLFVGLCREQPTWIPLNCKKATILIKPRKIGDDLRQIELGILKCDRPSALKRAIELVVENWDEIERLALRVIDQWNRTEVGIPKCETVEVLGAQLPVRCEKQII